MAMGKQLRPYAPCPSQYGVQSCSRIVLSHRGVGKGDSQEGLQGAGRASGGSEWGSGESQGGGLCLPQAAPAPTAFPFTLICCKEGRGLAQLENQVTLLCKGAVRGHLTPCLCSHVGHISATAADISSMSPRQTPARTNCSPLL